MNKERKNNLQNNIKTNDSDDEKPGDDNVIEASDIVAMIIAVFQILFPYIIIILVSFTLFMFLVTEVWLK